MRDYLDRLAQIGTLTLFGDHGIVNLSGGYVVGFGCMHAQKTLVVAQVQVCLGAVISHIALSMLVGIQRARINVYVRVKLLDCNLEAAGLKQFGKRCGNNTLAQR